MGGVFSLKTLNYDSMSNRGSGRKEGRGFFRLLSHLDLFVNFSYEIPALKLKIVLLFQQIKRQLE